jgi:cytochrome c oxidase subunit IV
MAHADTAGTTTSNTRVYWATWSVLLAFTLLMVWLDGISLPRQVFALIMLAAMLVKATLIAANFMHLRLERLSLSLMVVVGLLVTGVVLYVLIVPDAVRIHGMLPR